MYFFYSKSFAKRHACLRPLRWQLLLWIAALALVALFLKCCYAVVVGMVNPVGPLLCNRSCSWDEDLASTQPYRTDIPLHTTANGNSARVIFMIISSNFDELVCQNVASAFLSGAVTMVVGVNTEFKKINKMEHILEAANLVQLDDSDVVVYVDRDTVFTGTSPFLFLDDFIDRSARTAEDLNVRAVRTSEAIAPFLIGTENGCYSWQTFSVGPPCEQFATLVPDFVIKHYGKLLSKDGIVYDTQRYNRTEYPMQFINSGVAVARKWALEEVNSGIKRVLHYGRQNVMSHGDFTSDQSLVHLLFHDLMMFEIQTDAVYRADGMAELTSQFGLHAGVMDFDYRQHVAALSEVSDRLRVNLQHWRGGGTSAPEIRFQKQYFYHLEEDEKRAEAAQLKLAKFMRTSHAEPVFEKRDVSFLHTDIQQVNVAPPMIGSKSSTTGPPSFPFLLHCTDYDKMRRLQYYSLFTSWALPIQTSRTDYMRARQLLQSSSITYVGLVSGKTDVAVVGYADTCPFPFAEWSSILQPSHRK